MTHRAIWWRVSLVLQTSKVKYTQSVTWPQLNIAPTTDIIHSLSLPGTDYQHWSPINSSINLWTYSLCLLCTFFSEFTQLLPSGECYYNTLLLRLFFIVEYGSVRFLGHHPHPLGYLCAKLCFFHDLHCWASPWRKITYSVNQSLNHSPSSFDVLGTEALSLRNILQTKCIGNICRELNTQEWEFLVHDEISRTPAGPIQ